MDFTKCSLCKQASHSGPCRKQRTDTERLDWLQRQIELDVATGREVLNLWNAVNANATLREAIDAAMEAEYEQPSQ